MSKLIKYEEIFINPERVMQNIIENDYYKNWSEDDFKILEKIIGYLKLEIMSINDVPLASPFMCIYLAKYNWRDDIGGNVLPFAEPFKKYFWKKGDGKSKFIELFPGTSHNLEKEFETLQRIYQNEIDIPVSRIYGLLIDKISKVWKHINNEIIDRYFSRSAEFCSLNEFDQKFILTTYIDLIWIFDEIDLFKIRREIIKNLRGRKKYYIYEILKIEENKNQGRIFYIPIKTLERKNELKILNRNFKVWTDLNSEHEEQSQYLVVNSKNDYFDIKNYLEVISKIDNSVELIKSHPLIHLFDDEIETFNLNEVNHSNLTKKKWYDISDSDTFDDYLWKGANKNIKDFKNDIKTIVSQSKSSEYFEISNFISKAINAVFAFFETDDDEQRFLKSWLVLEFIANNMSLKGTYNDKIKQVLERNQKEKKSLIKEVILFRNQFVHGGEYTTKRISAYNAFLNIFISNFVIDLVNAQRYHNNLPLTDLFKICV